MWLQDTQVHLLCEWGSQVPWSCPYIWCVSIISWWQNIQYHQVFTSLRVPETANLSGILIGHQYSINDIVELWEQLKMTKEIFHDKYYGTHPIFLKQSIARHWQASTPKSNGSNHTVKTLEDDAKVKHLNKPTCTLHGHGNGINLCKFMFVQDKSWSQIGHSLAED